MLASMGYSVGTSTTDLDATTIEVMNTIPPERLINALTDARLQHYTDIANKDPDQKQFEKGWKGRAERGRLQALMLTDVNQAALFLNGLSTDEIERYLQSLTSAEIAKIHAAAMVAPGVGPESNLAQVTKYRFEVYTYKSAKQAGDWTVAASILNGFRRSDIEFYLKALKPEEIAKLHAGALESAGVGPDSAIAQMTQGSNVKP